MTKLQRKGEARRKKCFVVGVVEKKPDSLRSVNCAIHLPDAAADRSNRPLLFTRILRTVVDCISYN